MPSAGESPPDLPSVGESPPDLPSEDEYDVPSEDEYDVPSEDEYNMPSEDELPPNLPSEDESRRVFTLPDGFLGGNASTLQKISFTGISFPALPALLLSANNLISLHLVGVFDLFAPGTLVAGLAATTRLEDLFIDFDFDASPLSQIPAAPPSRAVLPALTRFQFQGDETFLETLVAQIDCPRLRFIDLIYADEINYFSELFQFIGRSEVLKATRFTRARVDLDQISIELDTSRPEPHPRHIRVEFPGQAYEVRKTTRFLFPASAVLTTVHRLTVCHWGEKFNDMDIDEWIDFFRLFPAVETLVVGRKLATTIDSVLNESTAAGVLQALRFLSLDGPPTKSVLQFISARKVSGYSVTLIETRPEEFEMRYKLKDRHTVNTFY